MKLFTAILILLAAAAGCTTKSKAKARAQSAFMAGQNAGLRTQAQGMTVSVIGAVRNPIIAWTEDLTLAKAIVIAEFQEQRNPREIVIRRAGQEFRISPQTLLKGEDIPLQPRDEIIINP
jgi:hypothetical protein